MPGVHKTTWDIGSSCHHEAREVCHSLVLQHIDGGKDDHTDQGDCQCEHDVVGSLSEVIRGLRDAQQDYKSNGVRCNGPQIGFDNAVSEPLNNLQSQ